MNKILEGYQNQTLTEADQPALQQLVQELGDTGHELMNSHGDLPTQEMAVLLSFIEQSMFSMYPALMQIPSDILAMLAVTYAKMVVGYLAQNEMLNGRWRNDEAADSPQDQASDTDNNGG